MYCQLPTPLFLHQNKEPKSKEDSGEVSAYICHHISYMAFLGPIYSALALALVLVVRCHGLPHALAPNASVSVASPSRHHVHVAVVDMAGGSYPPPPPLCGDTPPSRRRWDACFVGVLVWPAVLAHPAAALGDSRV
jgi:hypothetical protein